MLYQKDLKKNDDVVGVAMQVITPRMRQNFCPKSREVIHK